MIVINNDTFGFDKALQILKEGGIVTRSVWNTSVNQGEELNVIVKAQYPDENSKMTEPYMYMEKRVKESTLLERAESIVRFPLDISVENLFAEDWVRVGDVSTGQEA